MTRFITRKKILFSFLFLSILFFSLALLLPQNTFVDIACNSADLNIHSTTEKEFRKAILRSTYTDSLDYLKLKYGKNKIIPDEIKDVVLVSLSFYPELASTNICFKYESIDQTMNARPLIGNIFRSKNNRKYCIIINNNKGKHRGIEIASLSFNILIGWISHELSHIVEYEKLSNWQTLSFALKYVVFTSFNRKVERYTDFITIKHGLAYPLYDGVEYLLNDKSISNDYKRKIRENYLSLAEIKCLWQQMNNENK